VIAAVRKALVIGDGIAGPIAALALRNAGIEASIFEAFETPADRLGGMLMVAPNGVEALRIVGVDVRKIGQPISRMIVGDGDGKEFGAFHGLARLPSSQIVRRSDLYSVLNDRAKEQCIGIEYGKRLIGVHDAPLGITAQFADGSIENGDVLIGADGIRSTVRKLIDPSAPDPSYVGFLGFGGFAQGSSVRTPPDAIYFVFGKRAFLGYWAAPDGGTVWFSNLPYANPLTMAQAREVPAADWLQQLREVYADDIPGRDLVQHTSADQLFVFGAGEILPRVPRWYRGRMVLVGDSAHAPSSSSGQGASIAAESAIELAQCLRDLPDVSNAFGVFERLRRPRVQRIAAYAARQNNQKTVGPIAKALMSLLMPLAMRTFMKPEKTFGWMHGYQIDWQKTLTQRL
jgi:2-polyprenyl-6-methoxyphenol hydroxylase-like FAD-dependent oxidoreductase